MQNFQLNTSNFLNKNWYEQKLLSPATSRYISHIHVNINYKFVYFIPNINTFTHTGKRFVYEPFRKKMKQTYYLSRYEWCIKNWESATSVRADLREWILWEYGNINVNACIWRMCSLRRKLKTNSHLYKYPFLSY